jgi:hemolysin activation/secretion protein
VGIAPAEPAGTAHLSYSLLYPDIPFLPSSIEWLTGQRPHLSLTFGYDKRFTRGVYDSLKSVRLDLRRSFSFSNYHELGMRFLTGFSSGELFRENRFFLGGNEGIRGYTPLRFEGDDIGLLSLEYRFPLLYETDINVLGLALTHTLQGAIFSDWGGVADTIEAFDLSEFRSDIGVGFRWFADSFGIMPVIFRFDLAWPIDSPVAEENEPHFYLSAGQPF